ncbi:MAG TPA: protein kinase [Bacteroidota bacterium]|nr:protein kinase [Bacteroidota bacterium]
MVGQTILQYRVIEKVGEGGMGVVYKAEDTKLERLVALKFLPERLNASEQEKARFIQEAKAASALNHPNVCTIHDIQEHDGQLFIVMEFVDGVTLNERKGSLSLKQSIDVSIQIADGLAAAHEKGIVHRDIKPENIMMRKDGIVQIMDFGLAKLRDRSSKITRLTKAGSTVGTAGYMSPEQVQGQDADHRSDIFSFGVLMYEMFTGQLPFTGVHETALAYEIVNVDPPPMSSVKPDIDPSLDVIVLECLAKDPSERCQSIAEISKDLRRYKKESTRAHMSRTFPARSGITQPAAQPVAAMQQSPQRRAFLPWGIAVLFFLVAAFLLIQKFSSPPETGSPVVASLLPPDSVYLHSFGQSAGPPVISSDGRNIAYVGVAPDGIARLYVRSLQENATRVLDGTQNAQYPFWSPDGKSIGYFADGKIKRIDAGGGAPITVCLANNPRGGTWSSAGVILFAPDFQSPIFRVSDQGGNPEAVTAIDSVRNESSQRWPFALPDGKHFLYFSRVSSNAGEAEGHAVYAASIDGKENRLVVHSTANAIYANGYLLFLRGSTLLAQRFDQSSLQLQGDPVPMAEKVINDPAFNLSVISASQTGILVYQQGNIRSGARLLVVDFNGKTLQTVGDMIEKFRIRYTADGHHVVASIFDPKMLRLNIWMYDLRTGARTRLTSGAGEDFAVSSPDGNSIIYASLQTGVGNMWEKPINGEGSEKCLVPSSSNDVPLDWSPDGSLLLFSRQEKGKDHAHLCIMELKGNHDVYTVTSSDFDAGGGRFLPDGKWIAFQSNESGDYEVYLRQTAKNESRTSKISIDGGGDPCWVGESEICYGNRENKLNLASLRFGDKNVEVIGTRSLFAAPAFPESYDISPDRKSIIINRFLEIQKMAPLTLMTDWEQKLKR